MISSSCPTTTSPPGARTLASAEGLPPSGRGAHRPGRRVCRRPARRRVGRAEGNLAGAQTQFAQVRANTTDPETLAYADLKQSLVGVTDVTVSQPLLSAYAQTWSGTVTGGWAALRLGETYLNFHQPSPQALPYFQGLAKQYAGTTIGEEAQLHAVDSLWGNPFQDATAYAQLLGQVNSPRIQRRALEGEICRLQCQRDWSHALPPILDYVSRWPSFAPYRANLILAKTAEKSGQLDQYEQPLRDMLPVACVPTVISHVHLLLGRIAYRRGDYATSESENALAEALGGGRPMGAAQSRLASGDLQGGLNLILPAIDTPYTAQDPPAKSFLLYAAAFVANQLGDTATYNQMVSRLTTEFPAQRLHLPAGRP